MPINEKQAHPRTRGRIHVRFGLQKLDRSAFTMNVSLTGAFIRTNQVFAPGQTIKLELGMGGQTVNLYGKVVWAKKVPAQLAHLVHCGMGVRFVNPGPEWVKAFESWGAGKQSGV
jgi:Tfp pilus assembly protein PilZ